MSINSLLSSNSGIIIYLSSIILVFIIIEILKRKVTIYSTTDKKIFKGAINLIKIENNLDTSAYYKPAGDPPSTDNGFITRYSINSPRFEARLDIKGRYGSQYISSGNSQFDYRKMLEELASEFYFNHTPKMELFIEITGTDLFSFYKSNKYIHKFLNVISKYHLKGKSFDDLINDLNREIKMKDENKHKKGIEFLNNVVLSKDD